MATLENFLSTVADNPDDFRVLYELGSLRALQKRIAALEAQLLKVTNKNRALLDPNGTLLPPLELEECLREAIILMEGIREGEYKPDSFTTQPWRKALGQTDETTD